MPQVPQGTAELDKEIFELQNRARANPRVLVPHLQEMLSHFEGTLLKMPGKMAMRTNEGKAAVDEAIECLNKMAPVQMLEWNDEL